MRFLLPNFCVKIRAAAHLFFQYCKTTTVPLSRFSRVPRRLPPSLLLLSPLFFAGCLEQLPEDAAAYACQTTGNCADSATDVVVDQTVTEDAAVDTAAVETAGEDIVDVKLADLDSIAADVADVPDVPDVTLDTADVQDVSDIAEVSDIADALTMDVAPPTRNRR